MGDILLISSLLNNNKTNHYQIKNLTMKKLLKIASLLMLLISSLTFAQYNPDGCIPDPIKILIKDPIPKDILGNPDAAFRNQEIAENLLNFKESLSKYSSGGTTVSQNLIDIIEQSSQTAYYQLPKSMVDKSTSIDDLRANIRTAIKNEKDGKMLEFYIGWEYQLQILQNSGVNYQASKFGWGCISGILGGTLVGAATGAAVGSAIPAIGTTAGAVVGGLIGGTIGGIKNCK